MRSMVCCHVGRPGTRSVVEDIRREKDVDRERSGATNAALVIGGVAKAAVSAK